MLGTNRGGRASSAQVEALAAGLKAVRDLAHDATRCRTRASAAAARATWPRTASPRCAPTPTSSRPSRATTPCCCSWSPRRCCRTTPRSSRTWTRSGWSRHLTTRPGRPVAVRDRAARPLHARRRRSCATPAWQAAALRFREERLVDSPRPPAARARPGRGHGPAARAVALPGPRAGGRDRPRRAHRARALHRPRSPTSTSTDPPGARATLRDLYALSVMERDRALVAGARLLRRRHRARTGAPRSTCCAAQLRPARARSWSRRLRHPGRACCARRSPWPSSAAAPGRTSPAPLSAATRSGVG